MHTGNFNIEFTFHFKFDASFGFIDQPFAFDKSEYAEVYLKKKQPRMHKTKLSIGKKKVHRISNLLFARISKKYMIFAIFPNYIGTSDTELQKIFLEEILYPSLDIFRKKYRNTNVLAEFPTWPDDMPFSTFYTDVLDGHDMVTIHSPLFWRSFWERKEQMENTSLSFKIYFHWAGSKDNFQGIPDLRMKHKKMTDDINPNACETAYHLDLRVSFFAEHILDEGRTHKLNLAVIWNPDEIKKLFRMEENRVEKFTTF